MKDNLEGLKNYLLEKAEDAKKTKVSKEQVLEMMNDQVFNQPDFKRQIIEVSQKLNLPKENVDFVVKHFLITMALQMTLVTIIRRRLSIYAFCMIEIKDHVTKYIDKSEQHYIKLFGKKFTNKLLSIFKN